jgi:hypothetical protein
MSISRKIKLRREEVASLLAKASTEEEIAQKLNVDQSTISRDIKYLKMISQQFVYDLAKSDLAYHYRESIAGIQEVKRRVWFMLDDSNNNKLLPNPKDQLPALKLAKECDEAMFTLFQNGPSVLNVKTLEERMSKIESGQISR